MTAINIQADARALPLPDNSVDLIVTSPPYFSLRSYQDGGAHYDGQIGSETTPVEYLDAMVDCVREWMRVLKPSGSIFINMGDKYNSAASGQNTGTANAWKMGGRGERIIGLREKSLLGVPWRLALRCIDDLDLILRAEIIWAKPNGLPESVTDRVRRSHEQVFHFTLQPRYYSAVDEVREEHDYPFQTRTKGRSMNGGKASGGPNTRVDTATACNPLGKLPGSVWSIPSSPLQLPEWLGVDHFAAYPPDLIRPIILGWSPPGICVECGEGRRPVASKEYETIHRQKTNNRTKAVLQGGAWQPEATPYGVARMHSTITGYMCACPTPTAPTSPAIVVDPFGGTGTTALVASTHGRIGIGTDLSYDYCRAAQWRTHDPGERARALKVEKPPPVLDGQLGMFEELA